MAVLPSNDSLQSKSGDTASSKEVDLQDSEEHEIQSNGSGAMWRGWYVSTFYCIIILLLFPVAIFPLIFLCKSDPAAVETFNGGEELPTLQWRLVQMSFLTCLFLDFISWLWTVDREKSRLLYFIVIINGLPSVSYGLLAYGMAPVYLDAHGRRLILIRYVQWLFTTPSMLYLYSIVSDIYL